MQEKKEYDLTITYDYKDHPDIISGRCDNCGTAQFKSSMKDGIFLRECRECGMKKII